MSRLHPTFPALSPSLHAPLSLSSCHNHPWGISGVVMCSQVTDLLQHCCSLISIPSPFLHQTNSYSSFKIQLKYPLPMKLSLIILPHLGSWWPPAQSSHCPQYLPPSLQAALSLFLSDIPLATIPCLRIHCRQILCAASPPARQMPPSLCRKH